MISLRARLGLPGDQHPGVEHATVLAESREVEAVRQLALDAHFVVARTTLVRAVGGIRTGYEGAQDYDFVLRTLHLSQFTVLRDVQAPAAPTNVLGFLIRGHLTLTWTPGADFDTK